MSTYVGKIKGKTVVLQSDEYRGLRKRFNLKLYKKVNNAGAWGGHTDESCILCDRYKSFRYGCERCPLSKFATTYFVGCYMLIESIVKGTRQFLCTPSGVQYRDKLEQSQVKEVFDALKKLKRVA